VLAVNALCDLQKNAKPQNLKGYKRAATI